MLAAPHAALGRHVTDEAQDEAQDVAEDMPHDVPQDEPQGVAQGLAFGARAASALLATAAFAQLV